MVIMVCNKLPFTWVLNDHKTQRARFYFYSLPMATRSYHSSNQTGNTLLEDFLSPQGYNCHHLWSFYTVKFMPAGYSLPPLFCLVQSKGHFFQYKKISSQMFQLMLTYLNFFFYFLHFLLFLNIHNIFLKINIFQYSFLLHCLQWIPGSSANQCASIT